MANGNGKKTQTRTDMANLIVQSLLAIEAMPKGRGANSTRMFVKAERVRRRRSLDPTPFQQDLYEWIRRQGFVRWELTLGMHYGMLGGLMARGLVEIVQRDGVKGIMVRA